MIIKKVIQFIAPQGRWKVPVIIMTGILTGLALYTFYISRAWSYVSDKPETCMNCHIMAPQYATWSHSSHRETANCNDCHVPHDNIFSKYWFKAGDGMRHATIFTMRREPQVIFIRDAGRDVVHQNCLRCHENQVSDARTCSLVSSHKGNTQDRLCWECHREVPHGRVNSLSSVPNARVPLPESPVPEWLKKTMKNESSNHND